MKFPFYYSIHGTKFLRPVEYNNPLALCYYLMSLEISQEKAMNFTQIMGGENNN